MQALEILFLLFLAFSVIQSITGPIHPRIRKPAVVAIGITLIALGAVVAGWRWQMLPALAGFALLMLVWAPERRGRQMIRLPAAASCVGLMALSVFLTLQLPIPSLSTPEGPYGVDTFEYSITGRARLAPTYSHWRAAMTTPAEASHPHLLFNHGLDGFASQNHVLKADRASHDYVVFSAPHPYESFRENPAEAGTVRAGTVDEICNIDSQCAAGANIRGTQGGRHWRGKVDAPFQMIYDEAHRAGDAFAYLPPADEFRDLDTSTPGTTHLDFVEMPLLETLGLAGPIDAHRTVAISNGIDLDFFDQHLKAHAILRDALSAFPEITFREHEIERADRTDGPFRSLARRVLSYWHEAKSGLERATAQALRDIRQAACLEIHDRLSRNLPTSRLLLGSILPACAARDRPSAMAAAERA